MRTTELIEDVEKVENVPIVQGHTRWPHSDHDDAKRMLRFLDRSVGLRFSVHYGAPAEPTAEVGAIDTSKTVPAVSIVIPTLNEVRTVDDTLSAVVAQSYSNIEVLVVDGESEDGTVDKLRAWGKRDDRIRLLRNPRKSIPCALNIALAAARGEYLVRIDAHSTVPTDYVERLVRDLDTGPWAGVGGRKNAVAGPPSGTAISAVLGSPFGVGGSVYHYATAPTETDHVPFGAYRVSVARAIGGWDERLVANEDYEFDVRLRQAGGRLFLDPAVEIQWRGRSRIRDLASQYRRYGRGKADVAWLHPSELRLRHLAPPILVAGFVVAVLLSPLWTTPLLIAGALYPLLLLALATPIARSLPSWRDRVRVPVVLGAMHFSWGLGFCEGMLRIARHGFRLPDPDPTDATRYGSPDWLVGDDPPIN